MTYRPKIIKGKVTGTGWPIDGHTLHFSQWDYDDRTSWHLHGWEDEDDEAVMQTMFYSEMEAGICESATLEEFTEVWKAHKWEPLFSFTLHLYQVEPVETIQEESRDEHREKLREYGIDLTPRKQTDKGGIVCLPLDENLKGDTQAKHPDWEPVECPHCGRKCWKAPEVDRLISGQGAQALCTKCALECGLISPYKQNNAPKPGGNREQRRKAKRSAGNSKPNRARQKQSQAKGPATVDQILRQQAKQRKAQGHGKRG